MNYWVRNLPQSLADSARTKINGDLKCSITWSSDGNYYDHDNRTIYLQVDGDPDARANTHTCAHEVGHYMTHVLAGYDRYKDMLNRMPCNWYGAILAHGFADYFEYRKYVVEEYAFLSDYLITGTVDGTNITSPSIATMFGSSGPEVKDFPSFEGYGVIMLGSLLRTNSRVNSFWYKTNGVSQAPVVGAPIGDVLALTVRGARDTNEMYTVIQDYLTSRGYTDRYKLPAMLEPLGWSYHGSGKVIDTNGSPVQNATVQSLTQNGSGEFRTPASSPTGTDGAFSLSRIFPGTNLIRVFYNSGKDSTTFQVTADSTKTTNAAINLGTIKVGKEAATKKFSFSIVSKLYDIANFKIDVTYEITGYGFESNAKNPEYALDIPIGQPVSVKATGTVTVEPLKLRNGDDNSYEEYSFGAPKVVFRSVTYSGIAVTETKNANPYTGSFTFSGAGQLLYFEAPVTVPYTKTVYTKGVGSYDTKGYLSYYGGACYLYSK